MPAATHRMHSISRAESTGTGPVVSPSPGVTRHRECSAIDSIQIIDTSSGDSSSIRIEARLTIP